VQAGDYRPAANSPALGGLSPIGYYTESGCEAKEAERVIQAEADAYVCSDDFAENNYGSWEDGSSPRGVGRMNENAGRPVGRQYYRFRLTDDIPEITNVYLRLKVKNNAAGSPHETAVRGTEDGWGEFQITWNNQPSVAGDPLDMKLTYCCDNVAYYDVTDWVRDQLAASDSVLSFVQSAHNEQVIGGMIWWQREGEGRSWNGSRGEAPELWINPLNLVGSPHARLPNVRIPLD
jgi:hypothetical protein